MPAAALRRENRVFKLAKLQKRGEEKNEAGLRVGRFSGYLAVFSNRDSYNTVLMPGCFTKTLQEKDRYPLLADHDACRVIGSFMAREDAHGLFIDAELLLDVRDAYEKWVLLQADAINGLSVGFESVKDEWDTDANLLRFLEVRLWEGSVVTFPANPLATVEVLRAMGNEARALAAPLSELATRLEKGVEVMGRAAEGDVSARGQMLHLLEQAAEEIEALREKLERAAASSKGEPAQGHSSEDAGIQELVSLAAGISKAGAALKAA